MVLVQEPVICGAVSEPTHISWKPNDDLTDNITTLPDHVHYSLSLFQFLGTYFHWIIKRTIMIHTNDICK